MQASNVWFSAYLFLTFDGNKNVTKGILRVLTAQDALISLRKASNLNPFS
jgi:hypothetical protein